MRKLMFAPFALAISLFGTQCWAQSVTCLPSPETEGPISCSNTFSPSTTTATYDFSRTGDGVLIVQFKTVLTTFSLTVTVSHTIDAIDFTEFPPGTVCVPYLQNGGRCDEYDFSGQSGGPNGVPVKDTDYKGLIMLRLSYFVSSTYTVRTPAFGHAPGDNATAVYTEDILTSYSDSTICGEFGCDPTMDGSTPGLSSVTALDKPFVENGDSFCSLSLQTAPFHVGQLIEVDYRLTNGTDCTTGIRDKTAGFSLAMTDSLNGNFVSRPALQDKEEANKFHWDNKNQLNEFDLSTVGLAPGNYTITVFSGKISPQTFSFTLAP